MKDKTDSGDNTNKSDKSANDELNKISKHNEKLVENQENANDYLQSLNKILNKSVNNDKESIKRQETTNDYLRALNNIRNDKPNQSQGVLSKIIGKSHDFFEQTFTGAGRTQGNELSAGIGHGLSAVRKIKESITGRSSAKDDKKLQKMTSEINRDKALLSAERERYQNLVSRGVSNDVLQNSRDKITAREISISDTAKQFGDRLANAFIKEKQNQDSAFRGISEEERGLLVEQASKNIYNSIVKDLTQTTIDQNVKSKSESLDDYDNPIQSNKSFNKPKNSRSSQSINRVNDNSNQSFISDKNFVNTLLKSTIVPSKNPSTYGEYVASIYDKLNKLQLNDTSETKIIRESGGSGGGLLNSMISTVVGSKIGSLFSRVKGSVASPTATKTATTAGTKTATKTATTAGTKTATKTATTAGTKTATKQLLLVLKHYPRYYP